MSSPKIDRLIAALRADAQDRVREMQAEGAPEDEIVEYINSLDAEEDESPVDALPPEEPR